MKIEIFFKTVCWCPTFHVFRVTIYFNTTWTNDANWMLTTDTHLTAISLDHHRNSFNHISIYRTNFPGWVRRISIFARGDPRPTFGNWVCKFKKFWFSWGSTPPPSPQGPLDQRMNKACKTNLLKNSYKMFPNLIPLCV